MKISFTDIVDLTHLLEMDMPHWPGDPSTFISPAAGLARDGYALNVIHLGEHSGTHMSAPSHFNSAGKTIAQIPVQNLLLPAMKIELAQHLPADHLLTVAEIMLWEETHFTIPRTHAVLLQTGWSRYWHNSEAYFNNGVFPGFTPSAAEFLIHKRDAVCLGIDSAGVDGAEANGYAVNELLAANQRFHLENLCNLEKISQDRFHIFIGALPIRGGHGSPCRVLALQ